MNTKRRRIHDGIAGGIITLGVTLGYFYSAWWLLVPAALGATLLQSGFTGFCPLYYLLDRMGAHD